MTAAASHIPILHSDHRFQSHPAACPLLGDVGGGAGATGGIEDEVAGVGGHENCTLNHFCTALHNIYLRIVESALLCIYPQVCDGSNGVVIDIHFEAYRLFP